jgi:hypothetical protein
MSTPKCKTERTLGGYYAAWCESCGTIGVWQTRTGAMYGISTHKCEGTDEHSE